MFCIVNCISTAIGPLQADLAQRHISLQVIRYVESELSPGLQFDPVLA